MVWDYVNEEGDSYGYDINGSSWYYYADGLSGYLANGDGDSEWWYFDEDGNEYKFNSDGDSYYISVDGSSDWHSDSNGFTEWSG